MEFSTPTPRAIGLHEMEVPIPLLEHLDSDRAPVRRPGGRVAAHPIGSQIGEPDLAGPVRVHPVQLRGPLALRPDDVRYL